MASNGTKKMYIANKAGYCIRLYMNISCIDTNEFIFFFKISTRIFFSKIFELNLKQFPMFYKFFNTTQIDSHCI